MKDFISNLILLQLGHEPTAGQSEMIDKLAAFVSSPDADSLFLLKGYAGSLADIRSTIGATNRGASGIDRDCPNTSVLSFVFDLPD